MGTGHDDGLPDFDRVDPYGQAGARSANPAYPPRYGAFPAPLPTSGAGITGFVLGLVGLVMCMGLTSPFGIWFSARGLRETAPTATRPMNGRGLAVAGMALSVLGLFPLLVLLAYAALAVIGIVAATTA